MISEYDFERLMIQQYVLYKKMAEIQAKLNGKSVLFSDAILLHEFRKEVSKVREAMRKKTKSSSEVLPTGTFRRIIVRLSAQ